MQPTYKFIWRHEAIRCCARMVLCGNTNQVTNKVLVKNKPRLTPLGQAVFIGKWNPNLVKYPQYTNQCYHCKEYCGRMPHVVSKYGVTQPA